MSSNKKRRELNRAIKEHDRTKLSAQFAVGNHSMLNIAESILAKENAALKADNELLRSLSFRDERDVLKEQVAQQDRQLEEMSDALRLKDDASREAVESIENGDCQTAIKVLTSSVEIPAFHKGLQSKSAALVDALEGSIRTFERINSKNNQAAEMSLASMKDAGIDTSFKWPGGYFEDIAEMAQGRRGICLKALAAFKGEK